MDSPTKYDTFQFCSPFWEINERLNFHCQPGRMLAGLNYDEEGTTGAMGEDNYPCLQPRTFGLDEGIGPGAGRAPAPQASKNTTVMSTQTIRFLGRFSRRDLFQRRDPTNASAPRGMLEWLALIIDAIETSRDGTDTIDTGLANTTERPMLVKVDDSESTESAIHLVIDITVYPRHHCRGERSYTFPKVLP